MGLLISGFLVEILRSSFDSIRSNKLRSFLTTLGIVIGVMTVVGVMSIISGLKRSVAKSFSQLGANVIYVDKYPWFMGKMSREEWNKIRKRKDIDLKALNALKEYGTSFKFVSPLITRGFNITRGEKEAVEVDVQGTSQDFVYIIKQNVKLGRYLSSDDLKYKRYVCVLGEDVVKTLFPECKNPIGEKIKIQGRQFNVIGILERRGEMMGMSMDNIAIIPFPIMAEFVGEDRKSITIAISVEDEEEAREEIRWILRRVRNLRPGEEDDFSINSSEALIRQFNELTKALFLFSIAIAGISLVVGGIGIMNIMLVSVSERTREIGIRKAIGAKPSEILGQFLVEAVVICLIGGIIGIFLGASITKIISVLSRGNLPFYIPIWSIFLGFGFCGSIGIFFGFFPARKASKLNPVEALRYE
ncbi:MAG: ABC transporter permease [candidate division WOR-3 bacterium]